jgi:hypothetical protein
VGIRSDQQKKIGQASKGCRDEDGTSVYGLNFFVHEKATVLFDTHVTVFVAGYLSISY